MNKNLETMRVTPEERDLIEQIRNYNSSYPNGYPHLMEALVESFYAMLKQPY